MANINGTAADDILVDVDFATNDHFNGKAGVDTLVSDHAWGTTITFDMTSGEVLDGVTVLDTFSNIENLTVGGGADVIGDAHDNVIKILDTGSDHNNDIEAGAGDDIVKAGIGDDWVFGNRGDDKLYGGAGNDEMFGGKGRDKMFGGSGSDDMSGGRGRDTLKAGAGDDYLDGNEGNDVLKGGAGDDIIIAGLGDDILKGGSGADRFEFGEDSGSDVIRDFEDGIDVLQLASFGFVSAADALSHFYEIGSASNDVVGFEYGDVTIKIKGVDLADIDASDLLI